MTDTLADPAGLPLNGLVVADFGMGMAAALTAKFLAEAGAEVHRLEPVEGDPFYDVYPAYRTWRSSMASVEPSSPDRERELLSRADICIVGGEDFPGMSTRHDAETLAAGRPRMVLLDIAATLARTGIDALHAADILVQARTGLVYENSADRPTVMSFVPSAYGAALSSLIAISTALIMREANGRGQIVRAGLLEGALIWAMAFWGRAEHPTARYAFNVPRGARPLIFKTLDGMYVHIVLGSTGAKYKLYKILGIDDPTVTPEDSGFPDPTQPPDRFFGDFDFLAPYAAKLDSSALLAALAEAGVVAESVLPGGSVFDDPQAVFNGIVARSPAGVEYVGAPIGWQIASGGSPLVRSNLKSSPPLAGIKVIDFGAFVAGPASSVGLADLGADVIKVEPPHGDPLRSNYAFYAAANRGKRSIAIEMKRTDGLELAHRLARQADVVCSNFRAGVAERLGIDAGTLQATQPEKIVLNNTGYGLAGPKVANPAFDPCMQASCGLEVRSGGSGNVPVLNRMMMVDFCGGLLGQIGVLMALYRRAVDGSGSAVTVPLLHAGMTLMSDVVRLPDGTLEGPVTLLPDQTGYHVWEKLYRTRDGWIAIAARSDVTAQRLADTLGLAGVAAVPRRAWGSNEMAALTDAIASLASAEAIDILTSAGVPAERCRTEFSSEYVADDRLVAAGRIFESERLVLGKVRGLGRLYDLGDGLPAPRGELSDKGMDGRAIMAEAGLSADEAEALIVAGTVLEH